jgi:hypothetical protein
MYSIYLDSPQLAVQQNQKKQYQRIINKNKRLQQRRLPRFYKPSYFDTAYQRFISSSASLTPGY